MQMNSKRVIANPGNFHGRGGKVLTVFTGKT